MSGWVGGWVVRSLLISSSTGWINQCSVTYFLLLIHPPTHLFQTVHKKILTVTTHYDGLRLRPATQEEKEASKKKLTLLRLNDEKKREKADARNSLEAYLYEVSQPPTRPPHRFTN